MSRYLLACPACGASVPPDDVQWDGAEGVPADFGICPSCGTTSEADEWVEAEDAAPQPCAPGRHCERYARGLGGCVAGHCNPPKPTVNSASTPEWAQNGMRAAMVKLSRALGHPNPVDCGAAQCVEAALIEMAAERLTRPDGVKASPDASAWWALVMGAAASIEDAANCLRDPDAKKQAYGAAKHYRDAAQLMAPRAEP